MGGFGSMESIAVGGNVVFEGFGVDGEVVFFVEAFELTASLLHGAELRGVPGGRVGE